MTYVLVHKFIRILVADVSQIPPLLPSPKLKKFPTTSPILVCSTKYDLPACVEKKSKLCLALSVSLSLSMKHPSPCVCVCARARVCVCVCVCVSMHRQLWSQSWREGSALGAVRKTVHPDSPAALYKEKGKRAVQPLYLDGLYWASCLRLLS